MQRALRAARTRVRGARRSRSSRGPSPSSSHSSSAAGFCARTESGPASIVKPSTCSVWISPPSARRRLEERNGMPAASQLVGGREAGDAAADDDHVTQAQSSGSERI